MDKEKDNISTTVVILVVIVVLIVGFAIFRSQASDSAKYSEYQDCQTNSKPLNIRECERKANWRNEHSNEKDASK